MTTKAKSRTAPAVKSSSYDAFVGKMLAPVPTEQLLDIPYNQAVRRTRRDAAQAETEMLDILVQYYRCRSDYLRYCEGNLRDADIHWREALAYAEPCHAALCRQMRTPAPDPAAVAWKKCQRKFVEHHMPEIDALIAADEAFLAAHPVSARKKAAAEAAKCAD